MEGWAGSGEFGAGCDEDALDRGAIHDDINSGAVVRQMDLEEMWAPEPAEDRVRFLRIAHPSLKGVDIATSRTHSDRQRRAADERAKSRS